MSELTQEQYDELPEFIKSDYTKVGDVYKHAGLLKVKQTANELDGKFRTTAQELQDYKEAEQERINAAKQEAYDKAKAEGNTEEVETRLKQQIADAQRREEETKNEFKERMKKLAAKQKKAIAATLSAKYAKKGGEAAFVRLVSDFLEVDAETDEVTYLDDNGSATSQNSADFEKWINDHVLFQSLIKADIVTSGGGNAKGSNQGRASDKDPKSMTSAERIEFKKRDPVGFKKAFNLT